jgi:hypothetical protein
MKCYANHNFPPSGKMSNSGCEGTRRPFRNFPNLLILTLLRRGGLMQKCRSLSSTTDYKSKVFSPCFTVSSFNLAGTDDEEVPNSGREGPELALACLYFTLNCNCRLDRILASANHCFYWLCATKLRGNGAFGANGVGVFGG